VEELLALEKTYRLQADLKATSMCCVAVVEACFEAKEWKLLNENVILISKRRAQLKQAVGTTVKESIKYIEETPDEETKIELIKTLQSVTEGKIYLELERARLTRKLANIYEARGKIEEAAETLQEVAVETFGAMAKTEKIAFILEQVRLCLKKKDFIRAFILVKKVTPRAFSEARLVSDGKEGEKKETAMDGSAAAAPDKGTPSLEELKLLYYQHLIAYYDYDGDALEMCRAYQNIYDTPSVKSNPDKWTEVLKKVCWYIVLAPSGPMQKSILHTVYEDDNVSKMPLYEKLLRIFVKSDIVEWTEVEAQFAGEMMEQDAIFSGEGQENRDIFKLRVVDHNILVIGNYYSQITLTRLADILKIGADEAEKYLSDLVLKKTVKAKINRPQGVITFGEKTKPDQALSQWSSNIGDLLTLVESCSHKIHKECQQYKVSVPSMN
jgi:26S proteasome regulatory subunit N5